MIRGLLGARETRVILRSIAWRPLRQRSAWYSPLSQFGRKRDPARPTSGTNAAIQIEEPETRHAGPSQRPTALIQDLKHYLKTDIPDTLQNKILRDKLLQLVATVPDFGVDSAIIPLINKVFLRLRALGGTKTKSPVKDLQLPMDEMLKLFERSVLAITAPRAGAGVYVPEYVALLAKFFLQTTQAVPPNIFVYVVELGRWALADASISGPLRLLLNNSRIKLSAGFTAALLKFLAFRGELGVQQYSDIFNCVVASGRYHEMIGEEFFASFIGHVERLYQEPPKVHEYIDLGRSVDFIQSITNDMIKAVNKLAQNTSTSTILKLARFSHELETVNLVGDPFSMLLLVKLIESRSEEQLVYDEVRRVIFLQPLDDEALAETLLLMSWSDARLHGLARMLSEFISADDVKFSLPLRIQARVAQVVHDGAGSEGIVCNRVCASISELLKDDHPDLQLLHTQVLQVALTSEDIPARGYFTQSLLQFFTSLGMSEPSVYAFKYQLDRAVDRADHVQAVNVFEDSLELFVQWPSSTDPTVSFSLNRLIVLVCDKMDNIEDVFPIFTKVKQQMVNCQCSIDTINAMTPKMLQGEFVGDTIELLNRELPLIKKEDALKLPLANPKYLQLFQTLHGFVLTYQKESTFETNWVLYGEVHRFFNVPYELYLPAMRFFGDRDRLNASLIIFRQMLRLSELHGDHQHLPPLREHYMYLFQTFGNKLYEEGVEEVHERLKMDLAMPKQDAELQNCLLNAYLNLQNVLRAKDVFLAMLANPKLEGGVNEESIQIMIKTYTYSDIAYVKKFWNNLSKYGIIPNYSIFKQYLIAHVYYGLTSEAIELTRTEMKDYELQVLSDVLLSMFNFTLDLDKQKVIAQWAENEHPHEWSQVLESGLLKPAAKYRPDTSILVEGKKVDVITN